MRELLSTKSLRQLELLEYLYDNDWLTLDVICDKIGYSEKSIRSEIQYINQSSHYLLFETSQKFGIRLLIPDNYSRTIIYSYVLSNSLEFKLLEIIFFVESFSNDMLAKKLFISNSTLRRMINNINKKLVKYNFSISTNSCKLIGSEAAIRNFMIHFIFEKYSDTNYPFPKTQLFFLEQLFYSVEKKSNFALNYPDIEKLKIWTIVTIIRVKNGHILNVSEISENNHFDTILSNKLFMTLFKTIFKLELDLSLLKQLFLIFLNGKYAENFSHLQLIIESNMENKLLYNKCKRLLDCMSEELNIKIINYDHVLLHFFNEINLYYGNNYILFDKHEDFIKNSNSQSIFFYKIFLNKYQNIFGIDSCSQSQVFNLCYCLIIHWKNLMYHLEEKTKPVVIGLFFNSDIEHMHFLRDYIEYLFHRQCSISIIEQNSISDFKEKSINYDIILTNIDGIKLKKPTLYCCSIFPTINDLAAIGKIIKLKQTDI